MKDSRCKHQIMLEEVTEYSIALQRAIEYHCRGKEVPEQIITLCPYHANMLNKHNDLTIE